MDTPRNELAQYIGTAVQAEVYSNKEQ